jgi:putative ABC transport system substrate-binding protein
LLLHIAALLILTLPAFAQAAGLTVQLVLTSQAKPFVDAAKHAKKALEEHGFRVAAPLLAKGEETRLPGDTRLCVAIGTSAARWALERTGDKATVAYCMVSDPEAAELDKEPRAVGLTTAVSYAAQLRLAGELRPSLSAIAVPYRKSQPGSVRELDRLRAAAGKGILVHAVDLDRFKSVAKGIDALFAHDAQFIWTYPDRRIFSNTFVRALLLESLRRGTPLFGFSPAFVKAGALLGVGIDQRRQGERCAQLLIERRKLLERGRSLPKKGRIEAPAMLLAVNVRVSKKLGIAIPKAWAKRITWSFGE